MEMPPDEKERLDHIGDDDDAFPLLIRRATTEKRNKAWKEVGINNSFLRLGSTLSLPRQTHSWLIKRKSVGGKEKGEKIASGATNGKGKWGEGDERSESIGEERGGPLSSAVVG